MQPSSNHRTFAPLQSIRDDLENRAWQQDSQLATRLRERRGKAQPVTRKLRWQDRALLLLGIALGLALFVRLETAQAQEETSWGMQMASTSGSYESLALDTVLHAEVTGLLARVHVIQTFKNSGDSWVEGTYRFPLPDGAAVDRLYIKVGERVLEGEIQERVEAQRVYQKAKENGQTASLVRQERANQFSTQLANIGPGEDIQVMIGFLVNVELDGGVFSLRLPTTFDHRFGSEVQPGTLAAAPVPMLVSEGNRKDLALDLQVDLVTDVPLSTVQSSYHDVKIQATDQGYRVKLLNGMDRANRDFEITWQPDLADTPQTSLTTWDSGDAVYAQLMLIPPEEHTLAAQPREVIFIIDTSGSMEGASLEQARTALLKGLQNLDGHDAFNLIQFNSESEALFPQSVVANSDNLKRARAYISGLSANGGTNMAPALELALGYPPVHGLVRQAIFVTDGSVGNERELLGMIAHSLGDSRLFTVSIGSAPNSWFMRKAAEIGRGNHTHIGRLEEVESRMSNLWTRIELPAIQNICIDWGVEAEYYPEVIPDLYAGEPLWVVARMPSNPSMVSLCGELNGAQWGVEALPSITEGNETLATLWARRKIESLQDSIMFGANPVMTRELVTDVALDYELLTAHTSLVAVDKTPVRMPEENLAMGNIPSLLPAGSTSHTAAFPGTATGWQAQLLLSILVLLVSGCMFLNPLFRCPIALSLVPRALSRLRAALLAQ